MVAAHTHGFVLKTALQWHIDAGADLALSDTPQPLIDRTPAPEIPAAPPIEEPSSSLPSSSLPPPPAPPPLGAAEARTESLALAHAAQTLDELRAAIAGFDGLALRETAGKLVFGAGNPGAAVMLVGDAPGAEDDRSGTPYSPAGAGGAMLDKILHAAGLERERDLYITTLVNWRPPGGRSPTQSEADISQPFLMRHIELVAPRVLVICGGAAFKALGGGDSLSKGRGKWIDYAGGLPMIATYDPAILVQNPAKKRAIWGDILKILERISL